MSSALSGTLLAVGGCRLAVAAPKGADSAPYSWDRAGVGICSKSAMRLWTGRGAIKIPPSLRAVEPPCGESDDDYALPLVFRKRGASDVSWYGGQREDIGKRMNPAVHGSEMASQRRYEARRQSLMNGPVYDPNGIPGYQKSIREFRSEDLSG